MKCPVCGVDNDRVIDSRASHDGAAIRRRRECLACSNRYNTLERADDVIRCPHCHDEANRLLASVADENGFAIRRNRECLACRRQFATFERSEQRALKVIKKDGSRTPFDRRKLKLGLEKACWKRPVSDSQLDDVVAAIENEVHRRGETEVPSTLLGELVMHHLRTLDQVAYVRFASVYRQFQDARDFVQELQPMLADEASRPDISRNRRDPH